MKKSFFALITLALMTACTTTPSSKTLVLYYSQYGATKAVAEIFAEQLGSDIEAIDVENPYDGDFNATIARCMEERQNGVTPVLNAISSNLDDYDTIFLGYPIWFGTYAPPVIALLNTVELKGKKIVPFCTFGSGGLVESTNDLVKALPDCEIAEGYGVRNARLAAAPAEIERFLVNNGYKEGEVEVLPEYSEQQPVTEEEAAIFGAACSSYQMPLGSPVTVGSRTTPYGTDYLFTAESARPDGSTATSHIYVTVQGDNAPEFTIVNR